MVGIKVITFEKCSDKCSVEQNVLKKKNKKNYKAQCIAKSDWNKKSQWLD